MLIDHEAVVCASGQHDQVPRIDLHPHPRGVVGLADVEVTRTRHDVADLIVLVDVLVPVCGDLTLVRRAHYCRRVGDLVTVAKVFGEGKVTDERVRLVSTGQEMMLNSKRGKTRDIYVQARVMGLSWISL